MCNLAPSFFREQDPNICMVLKDEFINRKLFGSGNGCPSVNSQHNINIIFETVIAIMVNRGQMASVSRKQNGSVFLMDLNVTFWQKANFKFCGLGACQVSMTLSFGFSWSNY